MPMNQGDLEYLDYFSPDICNNLITGSASGFMPMNQGDLEYLDYFSPDICKPIRQEI